MLETHKSRRNFFFFLGGEERNGKGFIRINETISVLGSFWLHEFIPAISEVGNLSEYFASHGTEGSAHEKGKISQLASKVLF